MNILFLTLGRLENINQHAIYPDLLRCFRRHGHTVYAVSKYEKRMGKKTDCLQENGVYILHVKIGNMTGCGIIKKGITTLSIEQQYKKAIKKYFSHIKFDLILYSTPPITFCEVIKFVKQRDNAKTYLLLKDIFPQNALDLKILNNYGIKGLIYKYFRQKEKQLYKISDYIGCMSDANVKYILEHNPEVQGNKVMICPNSIEIINRNLNNNDKLVLRKKYGIPLDKKVFVYGGNLGKPQGIDFLIECLKSQENNKQIFFLIIGDGTEVCKLKEYIREYKPINVMFMSKLPKDEYDYMIGSCDVGMIFLDNHFTIPNFPSRLLSYMQASLPVLAVTDPNTDIGNIIINGGFGWWCESNNVNSFNNIINIILKSDLHLKTINSKKYLINNYSVEKSYQIIMNRMME